MQSIDRAEKVGYTMRMEAAVEDQEVLTMGRIRIDTPRLLKAGGLTPMDLSYGAKVTPGTAYKLADEEECKKMRGITFDVLERVCAYLEVGISEVLVLEKDGRKRKSG